MDWLNSKDIDWLKTALMVHTILSSEDLTSLHSLCIFIWTLLVNPLDTYIILWLLNLNDKTVKSYVVHFAESSMLLLQQHSEGETKRCQIGKRIIMINIASSFADGYPKWDSKPFWSPIWDFFFFFSFFLFFFFDENFLKLHKVN